MTCGSCAYMHGTRKVKTEKTSLHRTHSIGREHILSKENTFYMCIHTWHQESEDRKHMTRSLWIAAGGLLNMSSSRKRKAALAALHLRYRSRANFIFVFIFFIIIFLFFHLRYKSRAYRPPLPRFFC